MKKKTYIHPSMETLRIETRQMLAISGEPHNEVNDNTTFGRSSTNDWDE